MEIRIVLLGGKEAGKSATANTILGRNVFKSAVTKCSRQASNRFGYNLTIVDTPGIFNQSTTHEHIQEEICKGISLATPGPHVFIVVLNKTSFSQSYQQTLDHFVKYFGEVMYKYVILLFTYGDYKSEELIEDFIETFPSEFQKNIKKCGGRVIVFNNQLEQEKRDSQVEKLIEMIRDVVKQNDSGYYTYEKYEEKTEKLREKEKAVGNNGSTC